MNHHYRIGDKVIVCVHNHCEIRCVTIENILEQPNRDTNVCCVTDDAGNPGLVTEEDIGKHACLSQLNEHLIGVQALIKQVEEMEDE